MKHRTVTLLLSAFVLLVSYQAIADDQKPAADHALPIGPPVKIHAPQALKAPVPDLLEPLAPALTGSFEGINFDDNHTLSGQYYIPPDPIAAAGPNHLVAVVNSAIEWYTKSGTRQYRQSLFDFFSPLAPPDDPFDPKVIYDQYAGRFFVACLVKVDSSANDPDNVSRILLAVSDNGDPNGTWFLASIDSKEIIGANDNWADYPGLAVDEEAAYITANIFTFGSNAFSGSRLWIIRKGTGTGGFYDGGSLAYNRYDPSTLAGLSGQSSTMQPAHVFGAGGVAPSVGTFLVSANWIQGSSELLSVIRVDNPLGSPTFTNSFVNAGDVHNGSVAFPDSPQAGTSTMIETNDRRALQAVWRDNSLWVVNTVNPPSGTDAGQVTAHWYEIDTASLNSLVLVQQGNIGGEDIAPGTHTFFPSIAVDAFGNVGIGFAASAPSIFPGAYYTGRKFSDPAGTAQPSETLAAGLAYYVRLFSSTRNRWGDYSGISVDPSDDATFWVFNEYALARGTVINGEDGRWGTRFGKFSFAACEGDLNGNDGDVDGSDLAALIGSPGLLALPIFAEDFGRTDCPASSF